MFIDEILKWLLMVESLLEILVKRRSQKFYKSIDVNSMENVIVEIKVRMVFLVVHRFCEQVINKMKKMNRMNKNRINRNHLDLSLGRRDRNCDTMRPILL